jgi:hypothetical protein
MCLAETFGWALVFLPIDDNIRKNRSDIVIGDFEPKIAFSTSFLLI